ncbi:MAG: DNA-binding response regulator [Nocardioidaceae bacterium]
MQARSSGASPMAALGFSAVEEDLYRILLRHSGETLDTVAPLLGTSVERLREAVAPVVAAGLVRIEDDRLVALAPDLALGQLISDEFRRLRSLGEQLDALRGMLPALTAEHLSAQAPRGAPITVERIEGGDIVKLVRSLSATSTGDLLWLRPDQWREPFGREIDEWVVELVRAGRRSRAIYPARVLEEAPDVLRERAAAGEHVRVVADLPSRMAVMGSAAVLIPEEFGVNDGRRLVIRHGSLIGVLTLLFENLWERAMPVPGLDGSTAADGVSDRRLLLDQLVAGAKDEQIGRALGLSLRTVRRRVADILAELGATSRFQAGVEAVRRGWL